jgi:hypothetical protein
MAKVLLALVLLSGQMAESRGASPAARTSPGYDQAIGKYVRFLETQKQTPVDYIMGLFAKYDIVVLCERAHPEITQYDMICELTSDKRFQQQVGHIFTECGSVRLRPAGWAVGSFHTAHANRFLMTTDIVQRYPLQRTER